MIRIMRQLVPSLFSLISLISAGTPAEAQGPASFEASVRAAMAPSIASQRASVEKQAASVAQPPLKPELEEPSTADAADSGDAPEEQVAESEAPTEALAPTTDVQQQKNEAPQKPADGIDLLKFLLDLPNSGMPLGVSSLNPGLGRADVLSYLPELLRTLGIMSPPARPAPDAALLRQDQDRRVPNPGD